MITDKDDFNTKPNFNNAEDFDICFNVLDPQILSGSVVDNNPLSFTFLQLINIKVDNQLVPRKRIAVSHAVEPLYLDQRTSLISYSPPSVFYNMIDLLKDYDASIEALDNLLYKAGAIIYKYPNQKFSGITLDVIKKSAEILEQKKNGNVIAISDKCTIEDFPINNVNGLIESVNKLEDAITKALNDTPASLLFDKSLSNGFSEGDKDKETEISIIEAFRENKLTPLYNLTDYYIMLKAFNNDFINEMKDKYNDFKDKTNAQIFYDWVNSFKYEFGNLFPEPESITIENNAKKLDNLLKLKELGANIADIEAELNEDEIFKNEMDLDGQAPTFTEGDNLDNTVDNKIDYNMYRFIDDKDFDESKIKRDKDGRFAEKNESGADADNDKKGLDNSDNNAKINNNDKEGDNDGRKQKSNSEADRQQRNEQRRHAFAKIQGLDSRRLNGGMSVFDKRRSGNSSQNGVVEYSIEAKPEIKAIFEGVDIPTPSFNKLKLNDNKAIDTFKDAITKAKQSLGDYGSSVDIKDDYTDINLYLSEDGESGFAIKPDGDIISLFSNSSEEGRSHYMLEMAKSEGGNKLDCFDIYLTKIYALHGFKAVARTKWNEEYKPSDWNKETFKDYNNGEPDVVFMVYDPEDNIAKKKIDAKKDFDEDKIKRDKDGKFAKKNESGDGDNKDNSKDADNENGNSKKYINKCIRSLPKHLQPIGKRLYSGEYGGGELVYKSKYSPIGGNHIDQDKLDNLSETEYSIFAFTEDGRSSSGWEERDNSDIIELIQKAPLKREALFRGEPENNIGELEVGKVINFDNKIRSFTNTEDGESIAKGFAFKYNTKKEGVRPVVYKINKPVHALCVNPLSYYQSQEDEHLCYGSFKITKILPKKNFDFIIIEPLE